MNHVHDRQLISALSELCAQAPDGLADRLLARWCYVEGPV